MIGDDFPSPRLAQCKAYQAGVSAGRDGTFDWRPIETAPKDGTTIWACHWRMAHRGMLSFWEGRWQLVDELENLPKGYGFEPTHWMPLPEPPISQEGK